MARAREQRGSLDIWPGFVDALSTLLMVIIFLLAVFVLAQFFLSRLLEGREETVAELELSVDDLSRRLALERDTTSELRASLTELADELATVTTEREDLGIAIGALEADRDVLRGRVAVLGGERDQLVRTVEELRAAGDESARRLAETRARLDEAQSRLAADEEELEITLAELARLQSEVVRLESLRDTLRAEIDVESSERGQLEEQLAERTVERREALERVELLMSQIRELSSQLQRLDVALGEKQAEIDAQNATIADLGSRLNTALARQVEELSQFRSDFFGELRRVLGDREDIRIVGDRFVFQSELLFRTGAASIGERGRQELRTFIETFKDIQAQIPERLPWVLQIDGHTDARPIRTARFPSNWELSTARAISVAQFLIAQGIPPERVAARGFASFQPLDTGQTEEAFRRNRRIEIKLTTR